MKTTNFSLFSFFFFCLFAHFALFWSPDGKMASSDTNFTGLRSAADRCTANSLWVCLGFCIHSKVDFGEKLSFEGYNKAEMKHTSDKKNIPRHEPWTQSSAKWDALTNVLLSQFSLLFWSYRSTFILLQCSLCKILLPSKFISSLGNWFNAFCCCPGKIKWSMTSHWMTSGH